jgi:hypothetical protein
MAQKKFLIDGGFKTNADSAITGNLEMTGHLLPTVDSNGTTGYDLGSPTLKWRDLYLSSGSLYVDGQKVLESNAGTIVVQADEDQSMTVKTSGTGVLTLQSAQTVNFAATLQMAAGKKITSASGESVIFGDKIDADNNQIINVANPTSAQHVATKNYVDTLISQFSTDAISEGDSAVEIADLGTGTVGITVDGTQRLALSATAAAFTVPVTVDGATLATQAYADTAEADAVTTANAYTDTRETAITSAYEAYADTAEADAVTTANSYTDTRETAITAAYEAYADAADTTLQNNIDAEAARIDAILLAADADKDTFAEIVTFINSVDTANDTALGTEITTRAAADTTLQNNINAEEAARIAADSALETSLEAYADTAEADAVTTANAYTDTRETAITSAYEAYADTAEVDAKAYTDTRETAITTAYEAYADTAEVDAKAYTDTRETAITTAYEAYADTAEADAVTTANAYTDAEVASATTALEAYADTAEADAVTTANAYTDTRETAITTAYEAYADTAEADAVTTANAYTDTRETAITTAYEAYADTAEADAVTTANAYTDAEVASATTALEAYADTAEADAKAYTDTRETAITTAYKAYADTAEADAKAYTDTRETAITTAYKAYADTAEADAKAYTDTRETAITTAYEAYADTAEADAKAYTDTAVANLIGSAPGALDTLNELAAALGDDENFASTVTNSIATAKSEAIAAAAAGNSATATKLATARTIALGGDVSGSVSFDGSANVTITATVADDSHNHVISNIDGLQTALDGKLATGSNAVSSSKWATARTITLGGDLTGSVSINGSANVTLTATVKDDSHNHVISNVDGLQAALDGKSSTSHNHTLDSLSNVTITSNANGEILRWNGSAWVNNTLAEAGIQAAGQIGNGTMTLSAGGGMSGGGSFTANQSGNSTVTISHADTSTAANLTASGRRYVTGLTFDTYGHVTGYTTGTETVVNTNTTYSAGNGLSLSGTTFAMSGSFTGNFTATGDITAYSDERLKENVEVIENALDKVSQVRGVTFTRKSDGSEGTGVIAQELQAVLPEAVHADDEGMLNVAYGNVVGLLIEAIKELKAEIEELKK